MYAWIRQKRKYKCNRAFSNSILVQNTMKCIVDFDKQSLCNTVTMISPIIKKRLIGWNPGIIISHRLPMTELVWKDAKFSSAFFKYVTTLFKVLTYAITHAKLSKIIFHLKIPWNGGHVGTILMNFKSSTN